MSEPRQLSNVVGRDRFVDPFDDRRLVAYFNEIYRWHGFIRFVGLPFFREEDNVPISTLFVEPNLTQAYAPPDVRVPKDDLNRLSREVITYEKLVILGDPGAGKSTIINWLAWQLTNPSIADVAPLAGYVPVPVVLRELDVSDVHDAPSFLQAVLRHPSLVRLKDDPKLVRALINRDQFYFLLDGLDEIPSAHRHRVLRAIRNATREYSRCRWLITSRVVGYDDDPLEHISNEDSRGSGSDERQMERRYIAPLTDEQIESFAVRWFKSREASPETAREFVSDVKADSRTHQLARLPNLLTLMAVVYRVQLRLPHGRALLYDKIAEAYLETMDASKRLRSFSLPLTEKKRILAYVAFQMQRSRGEGAEAGREILVTGDRLRSLIAVFLRTDETQPFIEYLCARSGLLQQRGPDHFAFAHLSFQEYFAALYLADEVTSPRWLRGGPGEPGTSRDDLRHYFSDRDWRELLILLFEILSMRSGWSDALLLDLFGEEVELPDDRSAAVVAVTALNPHSGLSTTLRRRVIGAAWTLEIESQQKQQFYSGDDATDVVEVFASAPADAEQDVWNEFTEVANHLRPLQLKLSNCTSLSSRALGNLPDSVNYLSLDGCSIATVTDLSSLHRLEGLSLARTKVVELKPLHSLTEIWNLNIGDTEVADLKPISGFPKLTQLAIGNTRVEPHQLEMFTRLTVLSATRIVDDLKRVARCSKLRLLYADYCKVSDLRPIQDLKALQSLSISDTLVTTLEPLRKLTAITYLSIAMTSIESLEPLRDFHDLEVLFLSFTKVSDISVVRHFPKLRVIRLVGTDVGDLSPLFDLAHLEVVALPNSATESDKAILRERSPAIQIY